MALTSLGINNLKVAGKEIFDIKNGIDLFGESEEASKIIDGRFVEIEELLEQADNAGIKEKLNLFIEKFMSAVFSMRKKDKEKLEKIEFIYKNIPFLIKLCDDTSNDLPGDFKKELSYISVYFVDLAVKYQNLFIGETLKERGLKIINNEQDDYCQFVFDVSDVSINNEKIELDDQTFLKLIWSINPINSVKVLLKRDLESKRVGNEYIMMLGRAALVFSDKISKAGFKVENQIIPKSKK